MASGTNPATLSTWETGKTWPANRDDLTRYLTGLGIDRTLIEKAFGGDTAAAERAIQLNSVDLQGSLDTLIANHTGDADLHEFERKVWQVGIPRVYAALLLKAATGEVAAARLASERFDLWRSQDAAKTVQAPVPIGKSAADWTQRALSATDEALDAAKPVPETEEYGKDR
jgi:hypothetical protein